MDATQGFRIVLANCKSQPDAVASRFVVWPGSYMVEAIGELYADRLVAAALHADAAKPEELADLAVRTFPSGLRVTKAEVQGPVTALEPTDFAFRAENVRRDGDGWIATGRAQGQYSYLLQSKEKRLTKDSRLLAAGRVERGGVSIGLLKNNKWAAQINITEPGDFTVVIAPPSSGNYSVLVANDLRQPQDLDTSVVLSRLGMVRK
jgi:hypothetical protein